MLLLTSTSDTLQIVTDSAAAIDVHATFVDTSAGTITPGRQNTSIIAAATTVVVPAPAAVTQRNVKSLHVRNKDAALSALVTIQIHDATGALPLYQASRLNAVQMLEMLDMGGLKGPV